MRAIWQKIKEIGPGAMVAAAFIGPGTITTATLSGASYGYTLLWAVVFSTLATAVLQEISARIGVVGQMGVGDAIRVKFKKGVVRVLASALVISAIIIGNAAYEAGNIVGAVMGFEPIVTINWSINPLVLLIGLTAGVLLYSGQYKLIEKTLVVLVSVMGIVFLVTAISSGPAWGAVLQGVLIPRLPPDATLFVIGLVGTTVVPYNLFLHAAAAQRRWPDDTQLSTARWDSIVSIVFGGIITACILITAATTYQAGTEFSSVSELGVQLQPIMGKFSTMFIAFGFLAAGLSSSVTAPLAAAFASKEIFDWSNNMQDWRFRLIWAIVLVSGIVFASLGYRPTNVILFAQVANGILLPVIAIFLVVLANDRSVLGKFKNSLGMNILGSVIVLVTIFIGLKGILSAFQII